MLDNAVYGRPSRLKRGEKKKNSQTVCLMKIWTGASRSHQAENLKAVVHAMGGNGLRTQIIRDELSTK